MKKDAQKRARCSSCRDMKRIQGNEYRIIERGHIHQRRFCSLLCIDAYLEKKRPDWFAAAEYASTSKRRPYVHNIRIKPRSSWNPYRDHP